ncbi:hypothetical protein ACERII_06035 [Evansella sp. AB-rgal1]|uniref:hypothetical protein n=1 Tax=Evansella sp. AB-rgal1 TaxID=3242696 RepID=UPI00359D5649
MQKKMFILSTIVTFLILFTACANGNEENTNENTANLQDEIDELTEELANLQAELDARDETISELEAEIRELENDQGSNDESNNDNGSEDIVVDEERLRDRADNVVIALENINFQSLANYVHPEKGVQFSPYGYVNDEEDLVFSADEVAAFREDTEEYDWGTQDGSGHTISLTPVEYYEEYIYIRDFSRNAQEIAINEIESHGNIIVNVEEAYPDADFVSYYVAASEEELDWANLILAFEEHDGDWYLVGLAVDRWTI